MSAHLVRLAALLDSGMSRRDARRSVSTLERLGPGAYASTAALSHEQAHLARADAVSTRVAGVVVSHVTAAVAWQLPVRWGDLEVVHLSPRVGRRGHPKRGSGHRVHNRAVSEDHIRQHVGLTATDPLLTTLDCARWLDPDWGVVIADAALHRGLITAHVLSSAAEEVRDLKGAGKARSLMHRASSLAESPGESLLRLRLRRLGLDPQEQVVLSEVVGRPRVDFLIDGWLVIEFDGRGKYLVDGDPAAAHWEEKQRQDRITEEGYVVLRVTWAELWDEGTLAARIQRVLRRGHLRDRA